ncbi:MAG: hypothetical protein RL220_1537 [Bacteroidota bacterium]
MNYQLLIALGMGLAGSLHCVGMCGPLHAALGGSNQSGRKILGFRLINHAGRILTYAALGVIAGSVGKGLASAGLQQWLSVISGILILLLVILYQIKGSFQTPVILRFTQWLRNSFGSLVKSGTASSWFFLGIINGLLPCGLVYFAMAGSTATGSSLGGALFMTAFGLGTVPALLSLGFMFKWIRSISGIKPSRWITGTLVISAALLILRGSNLGIPYISPKVVKEKARMECCHAPE